MTVVPSPARLSIPRRPPWASTMRSTMARPSPVPLGTRREERIERARSNLGVHSFAGVDDVDGQPFGPSVADGAHAHGERAVGAHRLHRVVDQVVEDLAQEVRVAPDAALARLDAELRADLLLVRARERQRPLEQIRQRKMGALDVDGPCVPEEIRDESIEAARLLVEDREERVVVLARDRLLAQAGAGVRDDRERVADLVRDDGGELPDHRELLLLDELLLGGPKVFVRPPELAGAVLELLRAALQLLRHGGVARARGRRDPDDERGQAEVGEVDGRERAARDPEVVDDGREQDRRAQDDGEGAALTGEIRARDEDQDDSRRAEHRDVRGCAVRREGSHDPLAPQRSRRGVEGRSGSSRTIEELERRDDGDGAVRGGHPPEVRPVASGVDEREVHGDGQGREEAHGADATGQERRRRSSIDERRADERAARVRERREAEERGEPVLAIDRTAHVCVREEQSSEELSRVRGCEDSGEYVHRDGSLPELTPRSAPGLHAALALSARRRTCVSSSSRIPAEVCRRPRGGRASPSTIRPAGCRGRKAGRRSSRRPPSRPRFRVR